MKPCPISGRPIVCPVKIKNDSDQTVYCFLSIVIGLTKPTSPHGLKKHDTFDYTIDDLVHDSISQAAFNKSIYKNSPIKHINRNENHWLTEKQKYYYAKSIKLINSIKNTLKFMKQNPIKNQLDG